MILCHGKQREGPIVILPETADLLRGLAQALDEDAQVIQGKRGSDERFGSTHNYRKEVMNQENCGSENLQYHVENDNRCRFVAPAS